MGSSRSGDLRARLYCSAVLNGINPLFTPGQYIFQMNKRSLHCASLLLLLLSACRVDHVLCMPLQVLEVIIKTCSTSPEHLVRKTCCWTAGQFSRWIMAPLHASKFFPPIFQEVSMLLTP